MIKISARLFDVPDERAMARKLGLEKGGRVQRYIDQTVIDFCQPYLPASPHRTLEVSGYFFTDIGSGEVEWNTPYAHYQYEGIVYGPSIPEIDPETGVLLGFWSPPGRPKHPTDKKLTYDKAQNPMAGPHWVERMKADRMAELLEGAQRVMERGE